MTPWSAMHNSVFMPSLLAGQQHASGLFNSQTRVGQSPPETAHRRTHQTAVMQTEALCAAVQLACERLPPMEAALVAELAYRLAVERGLREGLGQALDENARERCELWEQHKKLDKMVEESARTVHATMTAAEVIARERQNMEATRARAQAALQAANPAMIWRHPQKR